MLDKRRALETQAGRHTSPRLTNKGIACRVQLRTLQWMDDAWTQSARAWNRRSVTHAHGKYLPPRPLEPLQHSQWLLSPYFILCLAFQTQVRLKDIVQWHRNTNQIVAYVLKECGETVLSGKKLSFVHEGALSDVECRDNPEYKHPSSAPLPLTTP